MGLIFGSLPLLLKSNAKVSFSDLGLFSLCTMPYALKLFIAPIIDGGRAPLPRLGRRRGWIVPPLALAGILLLALADTIAQWVADARIKSLTALCFAIIALTAVQDVAVDGWSLELLSTANVAYASTCQSLGTSIGYLATFPLFLALNDPAFCSRYMWPLLAPHRTDAALSLANATRGVAAVFLAVAAAVATPRAACAVRVIPASTNNASFDVRKSGSLVDEEAHVRISKDCVPAPNVMAAYRALNRLLRLPPVQSLVIALLIAKLGFSAHDSGTPLVTLLPLPSTLLRSTDTRAL